MSFHEKPKLFAFTNLLIITLLVILVLTSCSGGSGGDSNNRNSSTAEPLSARFDIDNYQVTGTATDSLTGLWLLVGDVDLEYEYIDESYNQANEKFRMIISITDTDQGLTVRHCGDDDGWFTARANVNGSTFTINYGEMYYQSREKIEFSVSSNVALTATIDYPGIHVNALQAIKIHDNSLANANTTLLGTLSGSSFETETGATLGVTNDIPVKCFYESTRTGEKTFESGEVNQFTNQGRLIIYAEETDNQGHKLKSGLTDVFYDTDSLTGDSDEVDGNASLYDNSVGKTVFVLNPKDDTSIEFSTNHRLNMTANFSGDNTSCCIQKKTSFDIDFNLIVPQAE